jgi:chromosomal replication initiator protein
VDKPTITAVIKSAADHYRIAYGDIIQRNRRPALARPRQVAMFVARQVTDRSYGEIGLLFRRDHSTITHACKRVGLLAQQDEDVAAAIAAIKERAHASR